MREPTYEEMTDEKPDPRQTVVVNLRREAYDVYIGRPGLYGNLFGVEPWGRHTQEEAVAKFRDWLLEGKHRRAKDILESIRNGDLDGKRLGCYCRPKPCHGDVLREQVLRLRGCEFLEDGVACRAASEYIQQEDMRLCLRHKAQVRQKKWEEFKS